MLIKDVPETQEIINFLQKEPVRNSSIIGFIKNNPVSLILSEGESVLVKGTSDREWVYISSKDKSELKILLQKLKPGDLCFASIEEWMLPEITSNRKIEWRLTTMRYYLPESVVISGNKIKISKLNAAESGFILENSNYKQFLTMEYLQQRIEQAFSASVKINGKLVAWAITHDDGAIGALHVLEDHRNKCYAKEIIINLSRLIREGSQIPIAQIEEKNTPAIKLFEKVGFVKDRRVTWLKLK